MTEQAEAVRMTRDANEFPDSHHANVPAGLVAEFEAAGWSVDGEAGGLTVRELNADLESLKVEIDPADTPAEKLSKRDAARAAKAAK